MGQVLLVHGRQAEDVRRTFYDAITLFTHYGLTPTHRMIGRLTACATFSHSPAAIPVVAVGPEPDQWICAIGRAFYKNLSNGAAVTSMAADLRLSRIENVLAEWNGISALALHNRTGDLQVITDRLGSLHLYKAHVNSCVIISTSAVVLAAITSADWDLTSCREFLATGTVFENRSLFAGVEKLEPSTVLHFRRGSEQSRVTYWSVASIRYQATDAVPHLATSLIDAVTLIASTFKRPVLDLTGGFDSRALAGAVLRSTRSIDTFVTGADTDPDVVVSQRIARDFGLPHHRLRANVAPTLECWLRAKGALAFCDGAYDVFEYGRILYLQSQLVEMFDAEVNGSNGEVCKGYWWELLFPFTGQFGHFSPERVAAARFAVGRELPLVRERFTDSLIQHFAGVIRRANAGLEHHPNTVQLDNIYLTLRMQRWHGQLATASNRLWPNISPFMFRDPMEIALSTPPAQRKRNRLTRALIEYLDPALASLPLAQGYPALPVRINTFHRFGTLASEQWNRVYRGMFPVPQPPNRWSALWYLDEVRALLDTKHMASLALYDSDALEHLLIQSQTQSFGHVPQFRRVITLELLAQAMRSVRGIQHAASNPHYGDNDESGNLCVKHS